MYSLQMCWAATHHYGFHISAIVAAIIAMSLTAVSIFVCYRFADGLSKLIGRTAMTVIIRLSSFLLLCIGVQILWNGITALLLSLHLKV